MYDDFATEFYVVEKTVMLCVRIAGEDKTIRIEAIKRLPNNIYDTRAYILETCCVNPSTPLAGIKLDEGPYNNKIWMEFDLLYTNRKTADEAIEQALSFLREECKKRNT